MVIDPKLLQEVTLNLLRTAMFSLPKDLRKVIVAAYEAETSPAGKTQLKNIIDNFESAEKISKPICQDTGLISFYIKSREMTGYKELHNALVNGLIDATEKVPIRPNAVHPLTRKNTGNNVGAYIPNVQWLYSDIDHMELTVFPKGGGGENMSALAMLVPGQGVKGIKRSIVDAVVKAGAQPCPPTILGIGLGGTVDVTFKLAKLALLRPIGQRHHEPEISSLEEELLKLVNETGIGPMGLGGKTTCLDVKIEYAHCHTASLPVGLNMQCWADRKASAKIYPDRTVEYLQ